MGTITIQPGQPGEGMKYNPQKALPYPWHIDPETGDVDRQDFWKGDPARLMGFQAEIDVQRVALHRKDFAADPQKAVGMFAVFLRKDGSMYNIEVPITDVTVMPAEPDTTTPGAKP